MSWRTPMLPRPFGTGLPTPEWIDVRQTVSIDVDPSLVKLGRGEREAIELAIELNVELLLMDDRRGAKNARSHGLKIAGTPTILVLAAKRGLLDLAEAFELLKKTNFHYRQEIIDRLLEDSAS